VEMQDDSGWGDIQHNNFEDASANKS